MRWPQSLQADWEWEIYRDGLPLPARLREDGFKSERNARAAGTRALREFLRALREEKHWGTDAASQGLSRFAPGRVAVRTWGCFLPNYSRRFTSLGRY